MEKKTFDAEPIEDSTNPQYIFDLREGFPEKIIIEEDTINFNFKHTVYPNRNYTYYSKSMDIKFSSMSLFDTLFLSTQNGVRSINNENHEVFSVGDIYTPLQENITITLKPESIINRDKVSVYALDQNGGLYYQNTTWEKGKATFRTNFFGDFTFEKDDIGPVISPVTLGNNSIRFRVYDNLSGINSIVAEIDGEWLLMNYDPKSSTIWSERFDKSKTFLGELVLVVTDNENNKTTFNHKF